MDLSSLQSLFGLVNNPSGLAAIIVLTLVITQVVKQTPLDNKWMPLTALVIGALVGVVIGSFTTTGTLFGVVDGIISGFAASGSFDVLKAFFGSAK